MRLDGPTEPFVRRHEVGAKGLGQRDIHAVVGREVRTQFEDPSEQSEVSMSTQRKIDVIRERLIPALLR